MLDVETNKSRTLRLEDSGSYTTISVPKGSKRVVVCDSCRDIIGVDQGRPVDLPILDMSIRAHQSTRKRKRHEFEEVDLKDGNNQPYSRNRRISDRQ